MLGYLFSHSYIYFYLFLFVFGEASQVALRSMGATPANSSIHGPEDVQSQCHQEYLRGDGLGCLGDFEMPGIKPRALSLQTPHIILQTLWKTIKSVSN